MRPLLSSSLRSLTALASVSLLAWGWAAEEPAAGIVVEAPPGTRIDEDFVAVYPNGFVARQGDLVLLGDALRHDLRRNMLYAEGRVVLAIAPLRIHADRLGIDANAQRGEAWNVQAWIDTPDGRMPIAAEHISFSRSEIVFSGLSSRRYGGVFGFNAGTLRIRLREKPAEERSEPARYVSDVSLSNVRFTAFSVPWFWMPGVYRDFTVDYPWTQMRFGSSSRLGTYAIFRIASSLPEFAGFHTRAELRTDSYSNAGFGIGGEFAWKHSAIGRGRAMWFGIDEKTTAIDDPESDLGEHGHRVFDAEHFAQIPGGAVSLRYTSLPNRDPVNPDTGVQAPIERFRNDYLREDLNQRPFARQGAAVAWGLSYGTVVLDTERRPSEDMPGTDRLVGLQAVIPSFKVIGPLHADANGWMELIDDDANDHRAWRLTSDGAIRSLVWIGGIGFDADAGARGILYTQRSFNGVDSDGSVRSAAPYGAAGLRIRLEAGGLGWRHSLTPRVGIDVAGAAQGNDLSGEGFGDPRDDLDADHRWVVTGFDTALWRGRELFRASAEARFAIRPQDREGLDPEGNPATSPNDFVGIVARATGHPFPELLVYADLDWDARSETWNAFDVGSTWQPVAAFALRYDGSYNPIVGVEDPWEHRPGFEILGNRYALDGSLSLRPDGSPIDGWRAVIQRKAVDGRFGISYEQYRDSDGHINNRRFGLVLSFP